MFPERLVVAAFSFVVTTAFTVSPYKSRRSNHVLKESMQIWLDSRSCHTTTPERLQVCDAVLTLEEDWTSKSDAPIIVSKGGKLWKDDEVIGTIVDISTPTGLASIGSVEWVLADFESTDWRMIPAENLIVAAKSGGTKLAFVVERKEDIIGLARALELGVDAMCVRPDVDEDFWQAVMDARQGREESEANSNSTENVIVDKQPQILIGSCVRSDKPAVVADRVCIDLVQMLKAEEGCWVGSSAKLMTLVLSEAATSSLVPSRPFRFNAGPIHSYVLLADGETTKYLCELEPGDEILVYNSFTAQTRPVAVGRLKIETRPCMIVLFETEDAVSQIFLQQAETVRLGSVDGGMVRVTELSSEIKSKVLVRSSSAGTHIGRAYTGKVVEM